MNAQALPGCKVQLSEVPLPGKKPRKVFGRREAVVDTKTMRFEMRADGVHLWRKHSPKKKLVTWTDLVHVASGQGLLKLEATKS